MRFFIKKTGYSFFQILRQDVHHVVFQAGVIRCARAVTICMTRGSGAALLSITSLTTSSTLYLVLSFTCSKTSTAVYSTSWPGLMDSFTETANYLFLLWGICIKTPRFRDALSDTTTKIRVSSINCAKLFYFYYIIKIHYCCMFKIHNIDG